MRDRSNDTPWSIILFGILMTMAVALGWAFNLLALVHTVIGMHTINDITPLAVLRVLGVFFAPLGAILGWLA